MSMNPRMSMRAWLADAKAIGEKAASVQKAAADTAAENIKDPNNKGEVSIPGFGDGANRSLLGLPQNQNNLGEADKQHDIFAVSKPNGTGQGEYITPRDGNAIDAACKTGTEPLEKISAATAALTNSIKEMLYGEKQAAAVEAPAAAPAPAVAPEAAAPAEKQAANVTTVTLPVSLAADQDLMNKLASVGALMIGTEEGQRAARVVLEKEAGMREAQAIIGMIHEEMANEVAAAQAYEKQASAVEAPVAPQQTIPYIEFQKQAAVNRTHAIWVDAFTTDLEKAAYATGAADAEAAMDSAAATGEAAVPGAGDEPTMEQVMQVLQEGIANGEWTQEEAEAILQAIGSAGDDGLSPDEFADALRQAVESQQISPEQAEAIAQQYMSQNGATAEVPAEAAPEAAEAAAADPAVAEAAAAGAQKAASAYNMLWGNN